MNFAGLDIGGANTKFASTSGEIREVAFAFWKHKDQFSETLDQFRELIGENDLVGVTMTAELADCFSSKRKGVGFIVESINQSFLANHQPLFYRTDGTMCEADAAIKAWPMIAASNWHALAWLAFKDSNPDSGFVFDIGSTTTDIIPVKNGIPVIPRQDDFARLSNGQLFYGGIGRTPICSLLNKVELATGSVSLARELFATISDALIVLGDIKADENNCDTADGRSRSLVNACNRIARMVCSDADDLPNEVVNEIASQAKTQLVSGITKALIKVIQENKDLPSEFVTFGGGAWLAEEILDNISNGDHNQFSANKTTIRSFSNDRLVNQTAPALAVARKRKEVFLKTKQLSS